jgi:hypothetical protein
VSERRCKSCEQTLPLTAFNRYKDGHQWWCRECFKVYFRERGRLHLSQVEASRNARRQKAREYVLERLRNEPCVDCGEDDAVVLEFDHLTEKAREVAALVSGAAPLALIEVEIAKCEVVCCNCHRRRTYRRRGVDRSPGSTQRITRWRRRRNIEWLYSMLGASKCVDCGVADRLVLEFDHIGRKRANVMDLAWDEYGIETIELEIANCEIRCANCHRRKTAARGDHFRHRAMTSEIAAAKLPDGPLAQRVSAPDF